MAHYTVNMRRGKKKNTEKVKAKSYFIKGITFHTKSFTATTANKAKAGK